MDRRQRCAREGCNKRVNLRADGGYYQYCRALCRLVAEELTAAQNVCQYLGGHGDLYAAAVVLADALSEFDRLDYQALNAARDAGLTPSEYRAVKNG